jgi:hypothetical protein
MPFDVQLHGQSLTVVTERYSAGGRVALELVDEEGPYARATINPPRGVELADDEVLIKNYSENEGVLPALIAAGVITAPHRHVPLGYVNGPVCRVTPAFREYAGLGL